MWGGSENEAGLLARAAVLARGRGVVGTPSEVEVPALPGTDRPSKLVSPPLGIVPSLFT